MIQDVAMQKRYKNDENLDIYLTNLQHDRMQLNKNSVCGDIRFHGKWDIGKNAVFWSNVLHLLQFLSWVQSKNEEAKEQVVEELIFMPSAAEDARGIAVPSESIHTP